MRLRSKEQLERVKEWFAQHEAVFTKYGAVDNPSAVITWDIETLYWMRPLSGHYAIRYVIMGPVLMVWGDLECAVYRWSSPITWEFLAGCDLQYFEGKCEASPKGRDYRDYDSQLALEDFTDALKERAEAGYEHPDPRLVDEGRQAIRYGEEDWREWIRQNGYDLFGDAWYEYVPDFGKQIAQTCAAHLAGIKMAVAQRAALTPAAA